MYRVSLLLNSQVIDQKAEGMFLYSFFFFDTEVCYVFIAGVGVEPYSHLNEMAKVEELMRTLTEIESSLNRAISEFLSWAL